MQEMTFQVFEAFTAATVHLHRHQPHRRDCACAVLERRVAVPGLHRARRRSCQRTEALMFATSISTSSSARCRYLF